MDCFSAFCLFLGGDTSLFEISSTPPFTALLSSAFFDNCFFFNFLGIFVPSSCGHSDYVILGFSLTPFPDRGAVILLDYPQESG